MFKKFKKNYIKVESLYNKIFILSRNKYLYTEIKLEDTFQNRINLIFLHLSFIFVKINDKKNTRIYKKFYQKMFDFTFHRIEINMREIGYGDVTVNKNMKYLVNTFYNILLFCKNYSNKSLESKNLFFYKYLSTNTNEKTAKNNPLIKYFNKYQSFCLDLSSDKVLMGELNFSYK